MANPLGLAPGRQAGQFDHVCMHTCIYKSIILVYWYVVCTCVCINHRAIINLEHMFFCVFVYVCMYLYMYVG